MSKLLASIHTIEELLEKIPDAAERLEGFLRYLQASEALVRALFAEVRAGKTPSVPAPDAEGELEFGLFLYWLRLADDELEKVIPLGHELAIGLTALRHFAPASGMTDDELKLIQPGGEAYEIGIVAADGTLWTFGKFAQLDVGWLTAGINYVINLLDPASIHHPYPEPDRAYRGPLGGEKESIDIAIIGDWGCGPYGEEFGGHGPAVAVMKGVKGLKPDCVIHLGDVYYCGTDERLPPREEQQRLLDPWDSGATAPGTNFTINSNHEMYGAAGGLIDVALAEGTPFAAQNGTPYFALEYGQWLLIGLDSAYFDPSHLYMKGALGDDKNTQQKRFVQSLGDLSGRKVMVMTHHNPMSFDGDSIVQNKQAGIALWDAMKALLGRAPDVWYWGHLHLGNVYNANSVLGKSGTLCRCVGHSAIPFGNAHGMNTANVDYYAHTPLAGKSKQVQNGFAMVTLGRDGRVIRERFYEVNGEGACMEAWSS